MATARQIEANRLSARKCTGPVDALIRYEWLSRRYMAADAAVWNFSLVNSAAPDVGLTYLQHSLTLSRAGRAFNTARLGYTNTLKEPEAAQTKRKAEETAKASETIDSEPKQSKPLDPKLVSFRQLGITPAPEPRPLTRAAQQGAETTPLAA
jgi:hypothetical protein